MFTYLSHLTAIGTTITGGILLLFGNVSGQLLGEYKDPDVQTSTTHSDGNVLKPEAYEGGRLYALVDISARPTRFMIDTGASYTVLTPLDAERLGFKKNGVVRVDTIGGEVEMLKGRVPRMKVGEVTLGEVDVLVSGNIKVSLLGVDTLYRLGVTHLSFQTA